MTESKKTKARTVREMFYVRMGSLSGVFVNMDDAALEFFRDESKGYDTLSEYIREVMLDHYFNEKG